MRARAGKEGFTLMWRRIALASLLLSAAALPAASADLVVKIEGLRSRDGVVRLGLYDKQEGFPERGGSIRGGAVALGAGPASFAFRELAPGTYAVTIYHDENANDKFDTTWIGLPDEGYGFSNDAPAIYGAPSFKEAAVALDGSGKTINIKLTYW